MPAAVLRRTPVQRAALHQDGPEPVLQLTGELCRFTQIDTRWATDTLRIAAFKLRSHTPVARTVVTYAADLPTLATLDDTKGISLRSVLTNCNRSLLLVSDDNISPPPRGNHAVFAFEFREFTP